MCCYSHGSDVLLPPTAAAAACHSLQTAARLPWEPRGTAREVTPRGFERLENGPCGDKRGEATAEQQ